MGMGEQTMDSSDNFTVSKRFKIKREIRIEPDIFYSEAFKSLSASAMRTFMRCLQKRSWINRKNHKGKPIYSNDGFIFPYAEAELLGIGTTQFWKNMVTLVEIGFLDILHQGGWYQKNERQKDFSIYKLSDRWRLYGKDGFKKVEKVKVLQPEFYIRSNLEKKKAKATSPKRSCHLHDSEVDRAKQGNNRLHKGEAANKQAKDMAMLENTMQEGTIANAGQIST
jgi:hypothetical protein